MTKVEGYSSPILTLRRRFDLFANLRPAVKEEIDLLIVRENTEDLYAGVERVEDGGNRAVGTAAGIVGEGSRLRAARWHWFQLIEPFL